MKFKKARDFRKWSNRPFDIPAAPERTYRLGGWSDWSKFLGTENKSTWAYEYLSYEDAREYVRKLKLKKTAFVLS
mgnify:CR=1 FL=1